MIVNYREDPDLQNLIVSVSADRSTIPHVGDKFHFADVFLVRFLLQDWVQEKWLFCCGVQGPHDWEVSLEIAKRIFVCFLYLNFRKMFTLSPTFASPPTKTFPSHHLISSHRGIPPTFLLILPFIQGISWRYRCFFLFEGDSFFSHPNPLSPRS